MNLCPHCGAQQETVANAQVKILLVAMKVAAEEPVLPGGMPEEMNKLLELSPELVLRSVVIVTKRNIVVGISKLLDALNKRA